MMPRFVLLIGQLGSADAGVSYFVRKCNATLASTLAEVNTDDDFAVSVAVYFESAAEKRPSKLRFAGEGGGWRCYELEIFVAANGVDRDYRFVKAFEQFWPTVRATVLQDLMADATINQECHEALMRRLVVP